jgi:hypothetical protein
MNENAQHWLKALRSGDFKQSRYALKSDSGYCCLGVACEVSDLGEFSYSKPDKHLFVINEPNFYEQKTDSLPQQVAQYYKIKSDLVILNDSDRELIGSRQVSLDELNDDSRYTFEQIADFIEKYQDQIFLD